MSHIRAFTRAPKAGLRKGKVSLLSDDRAEPQAVSRRAEMHLISCVFNFKIHVKFSFCSLKYLFLPVKLTFCLLTRYTT